MITAVATVANPVPVASATSGIRELTVEELEWAGGGVDLQEVAEGLLAISTTAAFIALLPEAALVGTALVAAEIAVGTGGFAGGLLIGDGLFNN